LSETAFGGANLLVCRSNATGTASTICSFQSRPANESSVRRDHQQQASFQRMGEVQNPEVTGVPKNSRCALPAGLAKNIDVGACCASAAVELNGCF
jgi:hypothetical protein